MTTYLNNYNNPIYSTSYNDQYNGVVYLGDGEVRGTGTLLYDGRTILTAAHVFDDGNPNITVYFDAEDDRIAYEASLISFDDYDFVDSNGDIALLVLNEQALSQYNRYDLYRDDDELYQDFTMVGYGAFGNGNTGENLDSQEVLKLKTKNIFEADMYDIVQSDLSYMNWSPLEDSILAADFDNGLTANDAIDGLLDIEHSYRTMYEGMIASGDSGGPAFIDNQIAGVASYSVRVDTYDINDKVDSSFGEIGAWQRVSYYQEWIDKTLRANYENAPTSKEEVELQIVESDDEIQYVYFFLEYLLPRDYVDGIISVDYTTIDGSAIAGEDYIGLSGTLNLYQDESYAVIPVEIIPDYEVEANEIFYLQVSNPVNASFGEGVVTLTASRTIIDDDGWIA